MEADYPADHVAQCLEAGGVGYAVLFQGQQVAAGTGEVTVNVAGASQAADRSRALADTVLSASGELGQHASALFKSVDTFLAGLRDAA